MLENKKIAVVVPAFNEELLIERTLKEIPNFIDSIVVVDDSSSDGTATRVSELLLCQPHRIVLIRHTTNQGIGGAVASGYIWCRDRDIDTAVAMARDAQMDPADIADLCADIQK